MQPESATLTRVLEENGWKYHRDGQNAYLEIDGEKLRYYDYPDEKWNIAVRKMILRNTLAELETALPPELNPGSGLSIEEMRKTAIALENRGKNFTTESPEDKINGQALAVLQFKLGGEILLDMLDKLDKGQNFESLANQYHDGLRFISRAHTNGEFSDLKIFGRNPQANAQAQRKLAINIRDIVNVEEPVEPLITEWYKKIAYIKKSITARADSLTQNRTDPAAIALRQLADTCGKLVEARRNEPEYAEALVDAAASLSRLHATASHHTPLLEAAQEIYWMARVREPLEPTREVRKIRYA